MKKKYISWVVLLLVVSIVSCKSDLEKKARERILSATEFQMKDYMEQLPIEISDITVCINNDSLCVLEYCAIFPKSELGTRNWMQYYIVRVKDKTSGLFEYYDQAYPIDGDIKLYDSSYRFNRLSELYNIENGNYASYDYYEKGMYEAAIVRTFKKPLYSGARKIE